MPDMSLPHYVNLRWGVDNEGNTVIGPQRPNASVNPAPATTTPASPCRRAKPSKSWLKTCPPKTGTSRPFPLPAGPGTAPPSPMNRSRTAL